MRTLAPVLADYTPSDPDEKAFKAAISPCWQRSRALWRDVFSLGHFTGAALVSNRSRSRVRLMQHKHLLRWMQLSGHAGPRPRRSGPARGH